MTVARRNTSGFLEPGLSEIFTTSKLIPSMIPRYWCAIVRQALRKDIDWCMGMFKITDTYGMIGTYGVKIYEFPGADGFQIERSYAMICGIIVGGLPLPETAVRR